MGKELLLIESDAEKTGSLKAENAQLKEAILELQREKEKLKELLTIDELTGVYNRKGFNLEIHSAWAQAKRHRQPLSMIMIDIDHFKDVNDTHGHQAGDAALVALGNFLLTNGRSGDIICRFGGEEFAVILPDTGLDGACTLANRLRAALEEMKIAVGDDEDRKIFSITASFGASSLKEEDQASSDLIKRADKRLYEAKEAGRNCVFPKINI